MTFSVFSSNLLIKKENIEQKGETNPRSRKTGGKRGFVILSFLSDKLKTGVADHLEIRLDAASRSDKIAARHEAVCAGGEDQ